MPGSHPTTLLFAQSLEGLAPTQAIPTWAMIAGLVLAGVSLLVLGPTVLGLRFARRQRELEHTERMRALELGHPLPGSQPQPPHSPGVMIGLWTPVALFGIAFVASQSSHHQEAWIAAAIVGTAAVICGTALAIKSNERNTATQAYQGKPLIDPAAYEELSERHKA